MITNKWKPKLNEEYYYINDLCIVLLEFHRGRFHDYQRIKLGNCFKTRKDAEYMAVNIKRILKGEKIWI